MFSTALGGKLPDPIERIEIPDNPLPLWRRNS